MFGDIRSELGMFETAMNFRVQRQQIIASNIANADTPQYKARDFDFASTLKSALAGRQTGDLTLNKTAAGHMSGNAMSNAVNLQYRTEKQSAVDGNTVDMDVERSALAENSMHYELLTRLISDRLSGIKAAMSSTQG